MDRILQMYQFGPHRVELAEHAEDDGTAFYQILVDHKIITDPPLERIPRFADLVRIYALSRDEGRRLGA